MPQFIKLDIFRITEKRSNEVYKTKKYGYHWFKCGESPLPYSQVSSEIIKQNGFPEGEYIYASTLDTMIDSRIPAGGKY